MRKLLLLIVPAAALLVGSQTGKTYTGVITDTMCGADHGHMGVQPAGYAKCVRDCVKSGRFKYALLTADNQMLVLSDQATPEKFAAQKVRVTGVLFEKTKILKVEKIEPAR